MPFPSDRRIWFWRIFNNKKGKSRGVISLLAALLAVAFSVLALGIIYLSQIHLRLTGYKITAMRLDHAAENGLKDGLLRIENLLAQVRCPLHLSGEDYERYKLDTQNDGQMLVSTLIDADPPLDQKGGLSFQAWENRTRFRLSGSNLFDTYFKAHYLMTITTRASLEKFTGKRDARLEAAWGVRAGKIPLPLFPIIKDGDPPQSWEEYLKDTGIVLEGSDSMPTAQSSLLSGEDILPEAATDLVQKAFNIEIFRPQDLTPERLREAIGLEPSSEDIPEGVYLIRDDLGLGGIFVQGDLSQMILAIDHEYQVVAFRQEENLWILRFSPSLQHTWFISPTEMQTFDLTPRGIIIVDGAVAHLGGGVVDDSGIPVLLTDEELPSVLEGVDLSIVSTDTIVLSSHIIHQGVKWQDGIPYNKDNRSQLHILATGQNLYGEDSGAGEIILQPQGRERLIVQASLTGTKQGIRIDGEEGVVDVLGSLHYSEFTPQGGSLRLHFDTRFLMNEELLRNAPHTRTPVLVHSGLQIIAWHAHL